MTENCHVMQHVQSLIYLQSRHIWRANIGTEDLARKAPPAAVWAF